ncbi:hypothetical protein ABZW30_30130 [Kitasatospora sp. NPDC004669]|uniref:hypothetical protein n=1 Tax=Kitasatospora sp. NPDC004669 TaxID=3154555 RepID=UPI0033A4EAE6
MTAAAGGPVVAPARMFLAEAVAAVDVDGVRAVWRAAYAAGEPRWYRDRIAAIGRARGDAGPMPAAA